MHTTRRAQMPVQITGPRLNIERLAQNPVMNQARKCDLHGQAWLELASISDAQLQLTLEQGCAAHLSGRRSA